MTLFSYRAVNDDNKEVRGEVDALDLDAATEALKARNLEVVELHEASRAAKAEASSAEQRPPELRTTFAFEGTDAAGTVRRGTIQSESKYQAFERLKQDQKLLVSMLSPLGVTPQFRDTDLENWQKSEMKPVAVKPTVVIPPPSPVPTPAPPKPVTVSPAKSIGFTAPTAVASVPKPAAAQAHASGAYHSLSSTLRLYAGWLLGWYGLFVALGYYAHVRALPWELPFVQAFFLSPLIFTFIVAIFLFLFLGSIQRFLHGRLITGVLLTIVGIAAIAGVRVNVQ